MTTKHIAVTIEKAVSDDYDARFIMSATTPDLVNDTIDKAAYRKNEGKKIICLFQHDPEKPMGYWQNVKMQGDTLVGDLKLASTNLGKMVKQLLADGVPLGSSLGFRGRGEPNKKGGMHFKEIEIFETSIVSVPCHPRAMQIAKAYNLEEFLDSNESNVAVDDQSASGLHLEEIRTRSKAAIIKANKTLKS